MFRVLVVLVLAAGFSLYADPVIGDDPAAVEFQPPAEWQQDWNWVWEQCGSRVELTPRYTWNQLRWFRAREGHVMFRVGDRFALGYRHDNRIYLSQYTEAYVIQHEILHTMIRAGGHPPIFAECGL